MAMTLRLDEAQTAALRKRAESEGCSMQALAKRAIDQRAIDQYLSDREDRLARAIAQVANKDAELLDRLSR